MKSNTLSINTDLVVMGTHGRRGITRLLLGSDTKTAVRARTAAHE